MFNKDSGLVKVWVRLLNSKDSMYTIDNVPNIGNLKEIVLSLIESNNNSNRL